MFRVGEMIRNGELARGGERIWDGELVSVVQCLEMVMNGISC